MTYILTEAVSIHAPAQGATAVKMDMKTPALFQSTPPRRGRLSPLEVT